MGATPAMIVCGAFCAAAGLAALAPGRAWLAVAGLLLAPVPIAAAVFTRPLWVPLAVLGALLGVVRAELGAPDPLLAARAPAYAGADVVAIGRVADDPRRQASGFELLISPIRVSSAQGDLPPIGDVLVRVKGDTAAAFGDLVEVAGRLALPRDRPGFDRRAYLAAHGANLEMSVQAVRVVAPGSSVARLPGWLRKAYRTALDATVPPPHSAVLMGVVLGIRSAIPPRLNQDLINTGLVHLLVLSGLKVAIFARLAQALLSALLGRMATLPALALIALYALVGGATPAAIRAAAMGGLTLVAANLGRLTYVWTSLAIVAAGMLAWRPELALDVGFQLSFLGTAAIVLLTSPIERHLPWLPGWLREPFAVTCAAQIGTLPLMAHDFGVVSPVAPIANALVLPLLPAMVVGALALGPLASLPALAAILAAPLTGLLAYLEQIASLLGRLPAASVPVPLFPPWAGLAYYAGLAGMIAAARTEGGQRRVALMVGIVAPLLVAGGELAAWTLPDSSVRVLAIGDGQGVLMSGPGGRILVDGGSSPARLRDQLGLALPPWGSNLEALLVTAPGLGHAGGLAGFTHSAAQVVVPGVELTGTAWRNAALDAEARGASLRRAVAGDVLTIAGLRLEILAPEASDPGDSTGVGYLAFRAVWPDGHSFCDVSDLDPDAQAAAAARLSGPCDELLLPSGGAVAPDPELLSRARPFELVISAAAARPSRSLPKGIIRRTDQEGTIVIPM